MDEYFAGGVAYKQVKNRNDIPDAVIFETLKRRKEHVHELHVLCGDGQLKKALSTVGVQVHSSVEELLKSPSVQQRVLLLAAEQAFVKDAVQALLADWEPVSRAVAKYMEGGSLDASWLPSDTQDADIVSVEDVTELEVEPTSAQKLGDRLVAISFTGSARAYIELFVHKSEWDIEDRYGFEIQDDDWNEATMLAGGEVVVSMVGEVSVKFAAGTFDVVEVEVLYLETEADDPTL